MGTDRETHYILDAYELNIVRRLEGHQPLGRASSEELSWSADSNFIFSGSADGSVIVWDITPPKGETKLEAPPRGRPALTLQPSVVLRPPGDGDVSPSRAVAFNPRYSLLGVGGQEFVSAGDRKGALTPVALAKRERNEDGGRMVEERHV